MIIQIYEIQTPEQAATMIALGVDHIGSVVQSPTGWRDVRLKATVDEVRKAGRKSSLIPLFTERELIARCIEFYQPDILHFCDVLPATDHNSLDGIIERQALIRDHYPELQIMRSIPIAPPGFGHLVPSLELASAFDAISDWFLTDTLLIEGGLEDQPETGYVGITGRTCDWDIARQLVEISQIPVILAGGIGPQNAFAGAIYVQPAGIDSCTRTNALDEEGSPIRFRKDPNKVGAMIEAVRKAQRHLAKK